MNAVEVAVVGGGPAGLSAAIAAARAGARVALLEENRSLGGQLRYRIAALPGLEPRVRFPSDLAESLIGEARGAGVDLRPGAVAWGLFAGPVLAVSDGPSSSQIEPSQIVLATGSTDLPFPFLGGSLPGVLTARATQILLHVYRVLPSRRFAVVGTGTEADELCRDVVAAGGEIVVRIDPELDGQDLAAEGAEGVRALTIAGNRYEVETIVVAIGRQPDAELALMADCEAGYDPRLGGLVPLRDADLRTSIPGILVAGDAAGVCNVATALAEGTFAGLSAAAALGLISEADLDAARRVYHEAAAHRAADAASLRAVPTHV